MKVERKRISCPLLARVALGFALIGSSPVLSQAQDLEGSIDSELDAALEISDETASADDDQILLDEGSEIVDDEFDLEEEIAPKKQAKPAPSPPSQIMVSPRQPAEVSEEEAPAAGEPNLAFERRVYRIFKNNGRPLDETRWSELLGDRKAEQYSVQVGDTLWDVSRTFFGDGFFWAKLWSENGTIENPHLIVPGKHIRFMAGTEAQPPSIEVSDKSLLAVNDAVDAPVYKGQITPEAGGVEDLDESELIPKPTIPAPKSRIPVLKNLPPSFVERRPVNVGGYDKSGLDAGKRKALTVPATIYINSYLTDRAPASVGHLEEIELGEKVASIGQDVFLQLDSGHSTQIGDRLSVVSLKGPVRKPNGDKVGPIVEVQGIVEVTHVVNAAKRQYRATVVYTVSAITVGSLLLDEPLPRTTFSHSGPKSDADVQVIGGEFDQTRRLLGSSAVIYLDGGSRAGLHEGDLLPIQARRDERREDTKFPDVRRPIALIKIAAVSESVATAVVLEALEEIVPGDRTGGEFPRPRSEIKMESADSVPAPKAPAPESVRGGGGGGGGAADDELLDEGGDGQESSEGEGEIEFE